MKKKLFIVPQIQVIHIQAAEVIVTSPTPQTFSLIDEDEELKEEDVW